jgi:molybdopterin molybdotransferase
VIGFEEAQMRVLGLASPVARQTLPIGEARGRWTSAPLLARRTQPARDLSAMDGYAIRSADLDGPWRLVGEATPGASLDRGLQAGETARIFTGAALPAGADTIVIQEEVARDGDSVRPLGAPPVAGAFVRVSGTDFREGDALLAEGEQMTPARIALAAMAGHGDVSVHRRVRVAVISTGDELVPAGTATGLDRLPSSNGPMLAAMFAGLPVDITDLGIVRDDRAALKAAFLAAKECDLIVTTGAASVGDHDLVRPALLDAGATIDFWKIAMRPGKPLMAGRLGDAVVLGLPGNPVSAFVTATLFGVPLIARLAGAADPLPLRVSAILGEPLPQVGPRTDFVRSRWRDGRLVTVGAIDSGLTAPLSRADALVVRPAGSDALEAGASVAAILLA